MVAVYNVLASPQFASTVTVDVGASKKQGSLKLLLFDKNGKAVSQEWSGTLADKKVADGAGFTQAIYERINAFLAEQNFDFTNDPITEFVLALPSAIRTKGKGAAYIHTFPNIENAAGEALSNIEFSPLENSLKRLPQVGSKPPKMLVVNDMMGGGAQVAQALIKDHGRLLKSGEGALFIMTGGGMGAVHILRDSKNTFVISGQEIGNTQPVANGATYEKAGASLPGLKKYFTNKLNSLITFSRGFINTIFNIASKKPKDEQGPIITDYNVAKTYSENIDEASHREATYSALKAYFNQVAGVMSQYRAGLQTQTVVLAGPIAEGLKGWTQNKNNRDWFKDQEDLFFATKMNKLDNETRGKLSQLLQEHTEPFEQALIKRLVLSYSNKHMLSLLFDAEQSKPIFKLITNLKIQSNAHGAALLKDAQAVGHPSMQTSRLKLPSKILTSA